MDEAYKFLFEEIKDHNKTVVAGISGGPDSMALIHLLLKLREEANIKIICAHVNHNVRQESAKEENDVAAFCKKNNIIFETMKIEEYSSDNFENEARIKRYAFFEALLQKYEASFLVTGHHGDDLIETILMRIVRGSTFKGYAGFSRIVERKTYKILRPFIGITKADIIEYNKKNNISYALDATNETDDHTRNRYRKNILPFLKKEEPNVHDKFLKFSQTILKYNDYMDKEMTKKIGDVFDGKNLNIITFTKLDKIMQERIVNYIMETIYHDDLMLISDVHTSLIIKLINSAKPNAYIYLPNNIRVIKSYHSLSFDENKAGISDYKLELTSYINLPNGRSLEIIENSDDNSNFICRLDSSELALPLYVRNKRSSDRMEIKGMLGHKKIKDIFIDEKISLSDRNVWPILVDSNDKIIWLPGLKKTKEDKSKKESYDIIIKYY
jgi:tRNA(Ile)-lysidine synthase